MPAYDLKCVCGHREERRVPMGQQNKQDCPKCGKRMVVVIHAVPSIWSKCNAPITRNHRGAK